MYTIQIKGMHCTGCKNLITMSLEDEGMTEVFVDWQGGFAEFNTKLPEKDLIVKLNAFFNDLKEYSYSDLKRKD
jgi:copper chaperone CopZ